MLLTYVLFVKKVIQKHLSVLHLLRILVLAVCNNSDISEVYLFCNLRKKMSALNYQN